ncbi:MAG: efflux RND transporter periplasmic adaptor subunit [Planctomycetaceae bacterium]|nr:efflux RND transporter periplasmic adaptor subunit [Planctomycetaceae bacterium]
MIERPEATAAPRTGEKSPERLAAKVQSLRMPPPQPARGGGFVPWMLVMLLAVAATYTALGGIVPFLPRPFADVAVNASSDTDSATTATATGEATTSKSSTAAPAAAAGQIVLESKGYIIPEQQILVSPQVSGRILELNFDAGQQVVEGAVLAVIDSTEYRSEYERGVAQVEAARQRKNEAEQGNRPDEIRQARAELAEAKTQLDQSKSTYDRKRDLFEKKIVTPQDVEDAQSSYRALVSRVESLTAMTQLMIDGPRDERKRIAAAELRAAEAELSRSKWRLDNTVIKAPISGTILKKNAELGNLVNPIAFNGSYSLCDIADLSKLEVELDIQERDIAKVQKNQRCRVRAEAFPERTYDGYVSRLMPIANRAKGAVPVRVRLSVPPEEQGRYLKPEMGATVTFFAETVDPAPPASSAETTDAAR